MASGYPAWAAQKDGVILRSFFKEIAQGSAQSDAQAKAEGIRLAFAHHPEILGWISKNRDVKKLLTEAGLGEVGYAIDALSPKKSGASDLLAQGFSEWLHQSGFSQDVALEIGKLARAILDHRGAQSLLKKASQQKNPESWMKALRTLGDTPYLAVSNRVERAVQELSFAHSPAVQLLGNPKSGVDIQGVPQEVKQIFTQTLGDYFSGMPLEKKWRIVIQTLELPPQAPIEKQVALALKEAGPAMQKTFQLFGKDAKSPTLRAVLEELKSKIEPFDIEIVKKQVSKSIGKPFEAVFSAIDPEPLGSGTVGQVHLATLKSGQSVVLKVRRPGIIELAQEEMKIFRNLAAGVPAQLEVVNRIEEALFAELNFLDEAKNTERGKRYRSESLGLSTVNLAQEISPTEDLLALEFVKGKPIAKLSDSELIDHGRALMNLLDRWVDESIFQSGYFHGDLHSHNLFYDPKVGDRPPFELTLLDFGSVDTLSLRERRGFVKMAAGVGANSKNEILAGLQAVAQISPEALKKVRAEIDQIPGVGMDPSEMMNRVFSSALDEGAKIPAALLKFNRGRMFIESQIQEVNARMDQLDPERKWRRFDVQKAYMEIGARGGARDLSKQIFHLEGAKRSAVTTDLVIGLFKEKATQRFQGAIALCHERYLRILGVLP